MHTAELSMIMTLIMNYRLQKVPKIRIGFIAWKDRGRLGGGVLNQRGDVQSAFQKKKEHVVMKTLSLNDGLVEACL